MGFIEYIARKSLLFEITVSNGKTETKLFEVKFSKGNCDFQQKDFNIHDSLEKWKHSIAFLSISGDQVISKRCAKGDPAIRKITENNELLWSIAPVEDNEKHITVSFLRKDTASDLIERLSKNNIYIFNKWISRDGPDKEKLINGFYEKEMNFSGIRKTPERANSLCHAVYYKLRLPVLLSFFLLLLGNFLINTQLRSEYESIQTELSIKQRNDKALLENQKRQNRLQTEYQKIPDCSFALIADRIASYVPATVQLNLLSVFPLESTSNNMTSRNKGLKLKTGSIVVKGEVEIPGSVTLFTQFLSSDKLFSKIEILSLAKQKDSSTFNFELLITL